MPDPVKCPTCGGVAFCEPRMNGPHYYAAGPHASTKFTRHERLRVASLVQFLSDAIRSEYPMGDARGDMTVMDERLAEADALVQALHREGET